jgi:hypothetical protein
MSKERQIVGYIRRDDSSWWAGCRYADRQPFEAPHITETATLTRFGARVTARRLAAKARRLRDRGMIGYEAIVGDPQ